MRDGHDPSGEAVAAIALRAEALLPPKDEAAQFAFGVVVRGLDAFLIDEGPQGEFVTKDVLARATDAAQVEAHAAVEQFSTMGWIEIMSLRKRRRDIVPSRTMCQ